MGGNESLRFNFDCCLIFKELLKLKIYLDLFSLTNTGLTNSGNLTLTRQIGLPPCAPVTQKIADQRWLIAYSAKNRYFFI